MSEITELGKLSFSDLTALLRWLENMPDNLTVNQITSYRKVVINEIDSRVRTVFFGVEV